MVDEKRLNGLLQPGSHDQHPPQTIDNAGDGRQKFHQGGYHGAHFFGAISVMKTALPTLRGVARARAKTDETTEP